MLFAAALLAASMIADADLIEPCPARDGVLLYRESGVTLLRLDGVHGEEPVARDVQCSVAEAVQYWKFAGFSAAVLLPLKRPFETFVHLVISSGGAPLRIDRELNLLPWDAKLFLHDSGTLLIVTGRHIERISSRSL